jgi:two-component system NtrC family response regulator
LYFRLAVVVIEVPPLRDRGEDIVLIAKEFLQRSVAQHGKPKSIFSPDALQATTAYNWPGNVRELQNRVQRAVIMAEGARVTAEDLELTGVGGSAPQTLKEAREEAEREIVRDVLRRHRGKITSAAQELGVSRPTLYELMEKLGIAKDS